MDINKFKKVSERVKVHAPEILAGVGIAGIISSRSFYNRSEITIYKVLYRQTGNEYYKIRYMQLTHTNNWLKMHGYPMNRKRTF